MERTKSFLILRENISLYDEKVLFFTEKEGLLNIYSFGSRSPKSTRGRALSKLALFEIQYTFLKKRCSLVSADPLEDYPLPPSPFFLWYHQENLKIVRKVLFSKINDQRVWSLTLLFSVSPMWSEKSSDFCHFLFLYSMLYLAGNYPWFERCDICGKLCSEHYFFDEANSRFIGSSCFHSREVEAIPQVLLSERTVERISLLYLNSLYQRMNFEYPFFKKEVELFLNGELEGLELEKLLSLGKILL